MSVLQQHGSTIRSVVFTCLCSVRASISDRTQPTLPSPPHTRILKVSNFWKRRSLTEEHTGQVTADARNCSSVVHLWKCDSPEVGPSVHQIKDLRRVQQLLEAPQELDPLIVSALGVDKHQQRAGAGRRAGRLPETFRRTSDKSTSNSAHWLRGWCCLSLPFLTVRVDAVECGRGYDGNLALTERTLGRELLLAA